MLIVRVTAQIYGNTFQHSPAKARVPSVLENKSYKKCGFDRKIKPSVAKITAIARKNISTENIIDIIVPSSMAIIRHKPKIVKLDAMFPKCAV